MRAFAYSPSEEAAAVASSLVDPEASASEGPSESTGEAQAVSRKPLALLTVLGVAALVAAGATLAFAAASGSSGGRGAAADGAVSLASGHGSISSSSAAVAVSAPSPEAAASATAAAAGQQPAPAPPPPPVDPTTVLSGADVVAHADMRPSTGCSNWRSIAFDHPSTETTVEACAKTCRDRGGCIGFQYQEGTCSGDGVGVGSCYLWSGTCEEESNDCWTNYRTQAYTWAKWAADRAHTRCSNFDDIAIGGGSTNEFNANTCGKKCIEASDCTGFAFSNANQCYIFKGTCDYTDDNDWDVYWIDDSAATQPTSEPSGDEEGSTGSTGSATNAIKTAITDFVNGGLDSVIPLEDASLFNVGDTVRISSSGISGHVETAMVKESDAAAKTITLADPVKFTHPKSNPERASEVQLVASAAMTR